MDSYYDYVVFGAGIEATLFAYEKANKNNSVIILNDKPYFGGSITESYHCIRQAPFNFYCNLVYETFNSFRFEKNGLIHWEEDLFLVSPATAKKVLAQIIENSNADKNLGISLLDIRKSEDRFVIEFQKDGEAFKINTNKILDASATGKLVRHYVKNGFKFRETTLNLFIGGGEAEKYLNEIDAKICIELPDKTRFISLNLPECDDPDTEAKEKITEINKTLEKCGGKILSAPPEVFRKYQHNFTSGDDNFKTVAEVINDEYGEYDELIVSDKLLSKISAF